LPTPEKSSPAQLRKKINEETEEEGRRDSAEGAEENGGTKIRFSNRQF